MSDEQAMTLREVADLLGFHYNTIHAKRHQIGFRLPGSREWRVWPSRLAELTAPKNNVTRLSMRVGKDVECQSAKEKVPTTGTLISQRQLEKELDTLLAQRTKKRPRNITTG